MWKSFKRIGWLAGFLGIDAWAVIMFIWSLRSGPQNVIGMLDIHPPVFLLLACLGVSFTCGFIVVRSWSTVRLLSPSNRFHDLAGHLDDVAKTLVSEKRSNAGDYFDGVETGQKARVLVRRLEKLSIKCPEHSRDISPRQWCVFFLKLKVLAEYGDIRVARAVRIGPESDEGRNDEVTQATRSS